MDKISGIIPSNARVTSVDMKDSFPQRATMPNRVESAAGLKPEAMLANQPSWKSKDAAHAAIVTQVAGDFFMKNKSAPEPEVKEEAAHPGQMAQPEGLFPKGSFIDRNA